MPEQRTVPERMEGTLMRLATDELTMPIPGLRYSSSNEKLQNAVKAREELSDILSSSNPDLMRKKLEDWAKIYSSVGISQLTKFTKTVVNRMDGIISRATFRISNGKIEGVNSFIKALRRSAFGYQDFD